LRSTPSRLAYYTALHPPEEPTLHLDPLWYKDAVIYQLHVRTFHDSNGDGIGDFQGLIAKLDYLQRLGVNCVWLLPFYTSPLRDDGYDIADYEQVHPSYGTLDDVTRFIDEAHARGLRVITELVINHTSDQHPWFQAARRAAAGSPERDFYVWSDTTGRYSDARVIFREVETSNWAWDDVAGAYYWHRFFSHQPDLNFDNPRVREAVIGVMRFWLDRGVDGLRLDAVPHLFERDGTSCENLPETHAFLKELRAEIDRRYTGRVLLAEANQWPDDVRPYFGDGDECHMAFHFPLMPRLFLALRREDAAPVADIVQRTQDIPATCQWAVFLRSHDELTLSTVTEDERDFLFTAYAADARMRLNRGIRRRLAPLLENHRPRIEAAYALLLSLPGSPVLYYGDEIGMGDSIELGDRDGIRTPMQWNGGANAGFAPASATSLATPVIDDPFYGYASVNVEAEEANPDSLLRRLRRLIAARQRHRAFGRGDIEFLPAGNTRVLAFLRHHEGDIVLVVANLASSPQAAAITLPPRLANATMTELGSGVGFARVGAGPYAITLGPCGYYWLGVRPR
jgi:maltose alpha-D-glucosyltransferase/alpha-amylase